MSFFSKFFFFKHDDGVSRLLAGRWAFRPRRRGPPFSVRRAERRRSSRAGRTDSALFDLAKTAARFLSSKIHEIHVFALTEVGHMMIKSRNVPVVAFPVSIRYVRGFASPTIYLSLNEIMFLNDDYFS